ncbi:inorganic pyrophosphatase [Methylomarinovum caldicuralii]|uniref:Inorganic pyrophosphatase n=1 Tax=Methylomarinovum caldicuralii TaxID=438856 RepID=A0AAU9CN63_9GAMM|nr:inorganic diphosphatase [Methylomarinovum caldicuralii]BCX81368.1 inorganic pyrophosphatase [Methylomarinovum caldicuralii]
MALMRVSSGVNVPHDINVIIEIPAYSDPVKYEIDKDTGALFVDRFMGTAMQYPCNYGYVPHTLSEDGDPVDVLVISPWRLISGSVVRCRPIGMLQMTDESGVDAKVLAVPVDKLTPLYAKVDSFRDIPESQLAQIAHFFKHYKDLEPGKWVKVEGWLGVEEAKQEILASVERYNQAKEKPNF